jgi:hypothetical protein
VNDSGKLEILQRIDVMLFEARCELEGMIAENNQRQHRGESMAFTNDDFLSLGHRTTNLHREMSYYL